jgi:hypothetical protein
MVAGNFVVPSRQAGPVAAHRHVEDDVERLLDHPGAPAGREVGVKLPHLVSSTPMVMESLAPSVMIWS